MTEDTRPTTGRPTKLLDDAMRETVLEAIRHGATIEAACTAAGITSATYRNWMSRGRPGYLAAIRPVRTAISTD